MSKKTAKSKPVWLVHQGLLGETYVTKVAGGVKALKSSRDRDCFINVDTGKTLTAKQEKELLTALVADDPLEGGVEADLLSFGNLAVREKAEELFGGCWIDFLEAAGNRICVFGSKPINVD